MSLATYSIVARDAATGDLGVAVATCLPAVGMMVPHAEAGVGAVANQALVNPPWGPEAVRRLRAGEAPEDILKALQASDPGHARRQIAIVDAQGRAAAYTGGATQPWAGHRAGGGFAVAGNILTGPETLDAMDEAFRRMPGGLADRLLAALEAGDAAGGDARGKQSAALRVVREGAFFNGALVDLRVDDHAEPVRELRRLYEVFADRMLQIRDPLRPAIASSEARGGKSPAARGTFQYPAGIAIRRGGGAGGEGRDDAPFHYRVDREGNIQEGRPPFLAAAADGGAATPGRLRIELPGEGAEAAPTAKQSEAAARLAAWLTRRYGIPAEAVEEDGNGGITRRARELNHDR